MRCAARVSADGERQVHQPALAFAQGTGEAGLLTEFLKCCPQLRPPGRHPLSNIGKINTRRIAELSCVSWVHVLYSTPADSDTRREVTKMQLLTVKIDKPEASNVILGQTHFIKSVEDIHEALVGAVPGIKFGLAFCEASGDRLVRWSGTDPDLVALARRNAMELSAGHCFIVILGDGFYPINVLNAIKMVPEVCRIFCATANSTQVVLAESEQGRGVLGVIDGSKPTGIEDETGIERRRSLLRRIGYKL